MTQIFVFDMLRRTSYQMVDECDRLLDILSEYQWKVKREVDMHEFFKIEIPD